MSDQTNQTASDHAADAVNYLTDPTAWYLSPGTPLQTKNMLIPPGLQAAANNLIGGAGTMTPPMVDIEDIEQRLKALEETSTHINVAKDQENRICELESVVTELMEFIKDQKKLNAEKEHLEELSKLNFGGVQMPPPPPQYYPGQSVPAYATISSTGHALAGLSQGQALGISASNAQQAMAANVFQQGFASHQHTFNQNPLVSAAPDTALDKAKRILGLK